MILGSILFTIGVLGFLCGIILPFESGDIRWGFLMFLIFLAIPGITIMESTKYPTKQDVLDGKAVYQETIHITNNDTIKTYDIVWKQKN